MSLAPKKCECNCHTRTGFFHCFTGPCCDSFDKLGEFPPREPPKKRIELNFKVPEMPLIKGAKPLDIQAIVDNSVKELSEEDMEHLGSFFASVRYESKKT